MMAPRAVSLLSGGLDSALATQLIVDQGIDVYGLHCSLPWGCCDKGQAMRTAQRLKIPCVNIEMGDDYVEVIRQPRFGYGSGMNPCVDCRIHMFSIARRYLEEIGGQFVITGEVLGQRPKSQMRDSLRVIERETDLEGRLLRPLSAQLLSPTKAEEQQLVDRSRLLAVAGRSRQEQLALAEHYGITEFATPAGGCLLTEGPFATKVRDLFAHTETTTRDAMQLLTVGRHFRLNEAVKVVIGRNELENQMLEDYQNDERHLLRPLFAGPAALLDGPLSGECLQAAMRLVLRYSRREKIGASEAQFDLGGETATIAVEEAFTPEAAETFRVGADGRAPVVCTTEAATTTS